MSNLVNNPCTLECQLFRYGICYHKNYYMCFDYDDWKNKSEKEKDSLILDQLSRVPDRMKGIFDKAKGRIVCILDK